MTRAVRALVLATPILLAWGSPALAATVNGSGSTITYTAAAGRTNQLTISVSGSNFVFQDPGELTLTPQGSCSLGIGQVTCPTAGITLLAVNLLDNNDTASNQTSVNSSIDGGLGADTLNGGSGSDMLTGGTGHDIVNAGDGADDIETADGAVDDVDCGLADSATDTGNVDDIDNLTNCGSDSIGPTDTQPPDTTITAAPPSLTNDSTPTFNFTATESSTFQCSLSQGAPSFSACAGPGAATSGSFTPSSPLADGSWTFSVKATDVSSNTDPTPDSRTFTVDTQAPDTRIDSGPSGVISDNDVQFTYSAIGGASAFECSLDGSSFTSCPTSGKAYADLPEGAHSFQVRAVDAAGNFDSSPAQRQFTIDTGAPTTRIDSGPGEYSGADVSFTYSASEPSTFECALDGTDLQPCPASGMVYSGLSPGLHFFIVRARDAFGNADANPPARAFFVDTSPPQTFISAGPQRITRDHTPTFRFRTNEEGAVTYCRFDGGHFTPCSDVLTAPRLRRGRHTFEVTSVDLAGNFDPTPAVRRFRVR